MVAVVRAGEGKGRKIQVVVDANRELAVRAIVVKRGETVVIQLRVNGVRVRAKGTAQQDGREGQHIAVLPRDGRRLLRGRVNGAGVVEVSL